MVCSKAAVRGKPVSVTAQTISMCASPTCSRRSCKAARRRLEGKQWMIGGLVQLTPSILLNANAFYIDRELTMPTVEPPGAGARVGLQLRF